jgi:hypothetical protein
LSSVPGCVRGRADWQNYGLWFGAHEFVYSDPPDWHLNPFTKARIDFSRPWYSIADFDGPCGDIKAVWEASRFDWLIAMAQRAALGSHADLSRLNRWLEDWSRSNHPYFGANWKCGQEASIRLLHLALAASLLDQVENATAAVTQFIRVHLARVASTFSYAIAQQNNHATSEAAALFVGGSWLQALGFAEGASFERMGRRQLERLARRLIATDGTFSQYSLVYHRVMLDTYCFAESWRRLLRLRAFGQDALQRVCAATLWLQGVIDVCSGDGPNLGANDGARLMGFTDSGVRDFRPTLQWAAALFLDRRAIADLGTWDQPAAWLGIRPPNHALEPPTSMTFDAGGLHVLRHGTRTAYLRYPRFQFRPSQADLLHVDLWVDGENVLRDGGTFSYNTSDRKTSYYSGTPSHNTVQFDGRDQMPRLSRFLFGAWPKAVDVEPVQMRNGGLEAAAAYSDWHGARHHRHLRLESGRMICTDQVSGAARRGVLRWRLLPGDWQLEGNCATNGKTKLTIETRDEITIRLTTGYESRAYLCESPLPVLEASLPVPASVRTILEF